MVSQQDVRSLALLGQHMRAAQEEFRRTDSGPWLWARKARERQFDRECKRILEGAHAGDDLALPDSINGDSHQRKLQRRGRMEAGR